MNLQYNQFGQLSDSAMCNYCPFVGYTEGYTIEKAFEDVKDYIMLPDSFNDTYCGEDYEDVIEDMINFFDFCDYSADDFTSVEEAFDKLYEFALEEAEEAKQELANAEAQAIESFQAKIKALNLDYDTEVALLHNFRTKGSASISYVEALEDGNQEYAQELLELIDVARYRHMETNYDELRQEVGRETARKMI